MKTVKQFLKGKGNLQVGIGNLLGIVIIILLAIILWEIIKR
ncbi:MAG TPA: hypothetical protein VJI73_03925 [Candidatus Paceibacterota bacterium]